MATWFNMTDAYDDQSINVVAKSATIRTVSSLCSTQNFWPNPITSKDRKAAVVTQLHCIDMVKALVFSDEPLYRTESFLGAILEMRTCTPVGFSNTVPSPRLAYPIQVHMPSGCRPAIHADQYNGAYLRGSENRKANPLRFFGLSTGTPCCLLRFHFLPNMLLLLAPKPLILWCPRLNTRWPLVSLQPSRAHRTGDRV